jgi:hypothetical protein
MDINNDNNNYKFTAEFMCKKNAADDWSAMLDASSVISHEYNARDKLLISQRLNNLWDKFN